jgi:hypothetical protein
MPIYKADQTLAAIDKALADDQGNLFRCWLQQLLPTSQDIYKQENSPHRSHLGASLIGRDCPRELWYTFRWATARKFDGRTLRLFNRGHMEEPRFLAMLLMIGCEVWYLDDENKQFRISGHGGHFGGGLDTVVRGVPEAPGETLLGEFKTHGEKSFNQLVTKGVREAKLEHYIQMQIYMGGHKLSAALYLAVNKNTDELYAEIIPYDEAVAEQYKDRAGKIIHSEVPPPKIHPSSSWFQCKFCDHRPVCHFNELPDINCRTCGWSQPGPDGTWACYHPKEKIEPRVLNKQDQLRACEDYSLMGVLRVTQTAEPTNAAS